MALTNFLSGTIYRTLDSQQSTNAEVAGYQLLGDAFNAPKVNAESHPNRNEQLKSNAPDMSTVKVHVEQSNLTDPRHETEGVSRKAQGAIRDMYTYFVQLLVLLTYGEKLV